MTVTGTVTVTETETVRVNRPLQIGLGTHCLTNGPPTLTPRKFHGHGHGDRHGDGEGTCKQALKNIPMFLCYLQRVIIFSAGD